MHSASSGKFVLVTVHGKRGKQGMDAAGVLPSFAGIACHDAWAPYDGYDGAAGHALCGAHLLRELTAVTGTGTAGDVIWARQAIDALLELKQATDTARAAGRDAIDAEALEKHGRWFRDAADAGIVLNAARRSKLQKKAARPGHPDGAPVPMTISGSPMTCGFRPTTMKQNRSSG